MFFKQRIWFTSAIERSRVVIFLCINHWLLFTQIYIIHTTTIYNQSQKSVRIAPPVSLFNAGCKFAWPFLATIAWRNFSRLGATLNQGEGEFGVPLSKPYIFLRTFHENIVRIFVTDCEIFLEYSVHKFLWKHTNANYLLAFTRHSLLEVAMRTILKLRENFQRICGESLPKIYGRMVLPAFSLSCIKQICTIAFLQSAN